MDKSLADEILRLKRLLAEQESLNRVLHARLEEREREICTTTTGMVAGRLNGTTLCELINRGFMWVGICIPFPTSASKSNAMTSFYP